MIFVDVVGPITHQAGVSQKLDELNFDLSPTLTTESSNEKVRLGTNVGASYFYGSEATSCRQIKYRLFARYDNLSDRPDVL